MGAAFSVSGSDLIFLFFFGAHLFFLGMSITRKLIATWMSRLLLAKMTGKFFAGKLVGKNAKDFIGYLYK